MTDYDHTLSQSTGGKLKPFLHKNLDHAIKLLEDNKYNGYEITKRKASEFTVKTTHGLFDEGFYILFKIYTEPKTFKDLMTM